VGTGGLLPVSADTLQILRMSVAGYPAPGHRALPAQTPAALPTPGMRPGHPRDHPLGRGDPVFTWAWLRATHKEDDYMRQNESDGKK
jgi:hypothetical protein